MIGEIPIGQEAAHGLLEKWIEPKVGRNWSHIVDSADVRTLVYRGEVCLRPDWVDFYIEQEAKRSAKQA
ncbi:MAG: hypothetical protein AAFN10_24035 [Bacteroidota bacterium]